MVSPESLSGALAVSVRTAGLDYAWRSLARPLVVPKDEDVEIIVRNCLSLL
jgi:hypothetical protein